jgi:hypothetical protein
MYEFAPPDAFTKAATNLFCDVTTMQEEICGNMLFLVMGFDESQTNFVSQKLCE